MVSRLEGLSVVWFPHHRHAALGVGDVLQAYCLGDELYDGSRTVSQVIARSHRTPAVIIKIPYNSISEEELEQFLETPTCVFNTCMGGTAEMVHRLFQVRIPLIIRQVPELSIAYLICRNRICKDCVIEYDGISPKNAFYAGMQECSLLYCI